MNFNNKIKDNKTKKMINRNRTKKKYKSLKKRNRTKINDYKMFY